MDSVTMRAISFLLFFFLITGSGRFSTAHPHQNGKVAGGNGVSTGEELSDEMTVAGNNRFQGRKMMATETWEDQSKIAPAAAWNSRFRGRECLNLEDGKSGRADLHSEGGDVSGFVAFNADYLDPGHHPPINN